MPGRGPARPVARAVPRSASSKGRFESSAWLVVGLLALLAAALTFDSKLYINGDNVDYMLLARDMRGGSLWPSNKYPPLFPALLAPVQALFGLALVPQKILILAFYGGVVFFLARLVRRRWSGATGAIVFWIAATLIPLVEYSHYTMSEVPYLFFLLGALDQLDVLLARKEPESGDARASIRGALSSKPIWWLALWLAASFYTRTVGIAAMGAVLLLLLLARRRAEATALLAISVLLLLPWALHAAATPGGNPYFEQIRRVNPYYPQYGYLTPESFLRRVRENAKVYFLEEIPITLAPLFYRSTYSPHGIRDAWFPLPAAIAMLVPLAIGAARGVLRRDSIAWIASVLLLGSCLWPPIWAGTRFLVPMVPLLYLLWFAGVEEVVSRVLRAGERGRARAALLGLVLTAGVLFSVKNLAFYWDERRSYPPEWKNYFEALQWIRGNVEADALVVDRKPNFVEFVAGRKSITFPREKDHDRLIDALVAKGATHVVISNLPYDDIYRYLEPTVKARKDYFQLLKAWREPPTFVTRLKVDEWRAARASALSSAAPSDSVKEAGLAPSTGPGESEP